MATSHDLRQPLQALRLFVYLLQTRSADPPDPDVLAKMDGSLDAVEAHLKEIIAEQQPPAASTPELVLPLVRQACRRLGDPSAVTVMLDAETLAGDPLLLSALVERLLAVALRLAGETGIVVAGGDGDETSPGLSITLGALASAAARDLEAALAPPTLGDPGAALGADATAAAYLARILDLSITLDTAAERCRILVAPTRPQRSRK